MSNVNALFHRNRLGNLFFSYETAMFLLVARHDNGTTFIAFESVIQNVLLKIRAHSTSHPRKPSVISKGSVIFEDACLVLFFQFELM